MYPHTPKFCDRDKRIEGRLWPLLAVTRSTRSAEDWLRLDQNQSRYDQIHLCKSAAWSSFISSDPYRPLIPRTRPSNPVNTIYSEVPITPSIPSSYKRKTNPLSPLLRTDPSFPDPSGRSMSHT